MHEEKFLSEHRADPKCFTRVRSLTYGRVVVLLLQKTLRSVPLHWHDFFQQFGEVEVSVSASAWSQARLKLRHTAFIELNERAVLAWVYSQRTDFEVRRWGGHRLLAIDSSLLRLPNEEEVGQRFGWVECENQKGQWGRYAQGRLSVLTDVLNGIAVESRLVAWKQDERTLACEHVRAMQPMDVGLLDRGYASYLLFAQFIQAERYFVCCCPIRSFAAVNALFAADEAGRSVMVKLRVPHGMMGEIRKNQLPEEIAVRFVSVRLSTGELEVLATNLLDEQKYPTEAFGEVYRPRWGIETYYGLLKGRLNLENFSGRTVASIFQDVSATVFLSNLETVLTRSSADELKTDSVEHKHGKTVNHAVCFHAIKSRIVDLLLSNKPVEEVIPQMETLFLQNAVSSRQRPVPRKKISAWRSYHHHRTERKIVF